MSIAGVEQLGVGEPDGGERKCVGGFASVGVSCNDELGGCFMEDAMPWNWT